MITLLKKQKTKEALVDQANGKSWVSASPAAQTGGLDGSVSQVGCDSDEQESDDAATCETELRKWTRKISFQKVVNCEKLQRQIRFCIKALPKMGSGDQNRMKEHLARESIFRNRCSRTSNFQLM